jgi:hypothetical protein
MPSIEVSDDEAYSERTRLTICASLQSWKNANLTQMPSGRLKISMSDFEMVKVCWRAPKGVRILLASSTVTFPPSQRERYTDPKVLS